jgi:hypothetical protein
MTNPASNTGDHDSSEMVFASPSRQFYHDVTTSRRLLGLSHLDNLIVTQNFHSFTGTLQKPQHRLDSKQHNSTTRH